MGGLAGVQIHYYPDLSRFIQIHYYPDLSRFIQIYPDLHHVPIFWRPMKNDDTEFSAYGVDFFLDVVNILGHTRREWKKAIDLFNLLTKVSIVLIK